MKKLVVATVAILGLLTGLAAFLLTTGAGLRWTVGQVLTRLDAEVGIGKVEGRLVGPLSLSEVSFQDPGTGTGVRLETVELDWRPGALFSGLLHVSYLRASGLAYTPGSPGDVPGPDGPPALDLALPLEVLVDQIQLEAAVIGAGEASPRIDRLSLKAALDAESVTLENIQVEMAGYGVRNGSIRLGLAPELPLDGSLEWTAKPEGLALLRGTLAANGALVGALESHLVLREPLAAEARSTVTDLFGELRWTVKADVPDRAALDGLASDWPAVSIQGTVEAEGDLEQARLRPDVRVAFQDQEATLAGRATVRRDGLNVERVWLGRPGAADLLAVSGQVQWAETPPRWTVSAEIPEPVMLSRVQPGWPALSVQGTVGADGDLDQARLQPELLVGFQDQQATLAGRATVSRAGLTIDHARIQRPEAADTITVSGRVEWSEALALAIRGDWQSLRGPDAAPWSSRTGEFEISGDLDHLTGALSGVVSPPGQVEESPIRVDLEAWELERAPRVKGSVGVPYFNYAGITARDVTADVDFDAAGRRESAIDARVSTLQFNDRTVSAIELQASGNLSRHDLRLAAQYQDWTVESRLAGAYAEEIWRAQLQQLSAVSATEPPISWRMAEHPVDLVVSPARVDLARLCLRRAAAEVCAGGRYQAAGQWNLDLDSAGLPLEWLAVNAPEAMQIDGTIEARAQLGDSGRGIEGEATARVARATIEWQTDEPVTTRYQELEFTATLDAAALNARLSGTVEDSGTIDGALTTEDPLASDGALRGRLSARLPSLRLLQAFVPALGLQRGTAVAALRIGGTRSAPQLDGEASIEEAEVDIAPLGIRLTALDMTVRGEPASGLRIEGRAASGAGTLTMQGDLAQNAEDGWQGEITLQGDKATLASLPQALIEGNPDLRVTIEPGGGRITGRLDISHALLTPDAGRPGVTVSDDIVVVSEETSQQGAANPMAWHVDVIIDLGIDTRFSGYGVTGRLSGAIELDAPPRQPARAKGSIEIHDGQYSLYGSRFDIQQGRLVYTGGPVDNPGIRVQIGREVGDVSVSLTATGPLVEPDLTLSSSKPMSETDKMSYLLLGRPASEASGAETGLLLRAASSLIPRGARNVPGLIESTLGLDTLEVRSQSGEDEGASVVLGKYLSPELYVSYVAGFQQAVDVFKVRYELARHWFLRAESSSRESGGDLLLTW